MATQPKRWPKNAEYARRQTIELSSDAERLVDTAITRIYNNPHEVEILLLHAARHLGHIRRLMLEAKIGRDEEDNE